jgi:hypothetical protein
MVGKKNHRARVRGAVSDEAVMKEKELLENDQAKTAFPGV